MAEKAQELFVEEARASRRCPYAGYAAADGHSQCGCDSVLEYRAACPDKVARPEDSCSLIQRTAQHPWIRSHGRPVALAGNHHQ